MAKKKEDTGLIKVTPSTWNPLAGMSKPLVVRQFEGLNLMNPFAIKETQATRMKNLTMEKFPSLTTRDGSKKIYDLSAEIPLGMGNYKSKELHLLTANKWVKYDLLTNQASTLSTAIALNDVTPFDFTMFNVNETTQYLVVSNQLKVPLKYDGSTISDLAGAPSNAKFMTTHDNRLYCVKENTIYYSALRKAEDWSTVNDAGSIVVDTPNGDVITKIVASSGRLTVFKNNSIHELYGTSPTNFQLKAVMEDLGCPYGRSVQTVDGIIFFVSEKSIYRYAGGVLPKNDFSIAVSNYVERINQAAISKIRSWTYGRRYYVALPIDDQTEAETILEYDLTFDTWTVWELNDPISCAAITINNILYFGNNKGLICQVDKNATDDNSTPIDWEWVSKPYTVSSIAQKATWYRLWVSADISANATFTVSVSTTSNGEDWTLVQTIKPNTDVTGTEVFIPTQLLYGKKIVRVRLSGTGNVTIYEITRQERALGIGLLV